MESCFSNESDEMKVEVHKEWLMPRNKPVESENKFYYQGKYFTNQEEFWAYVKEFTFRNVREEDFNSLFEGVKKDIWMNMKLRNIRMSNGELRTILEEMFLFAMKKIWKMEDEQAQ